jgi:hypothetical protein
MIMPRFISSWMAVWPIGQADGVGEAGSGSVAGCRLAEVLGPDDVRDPLLVRAERETGAVDLAHVAALEELIDVLQTLDLVDAGPRALGVEGGRGEEVRLAGEVRRGRRVSERGSHRREAVLEGHAVADPVVADGLVERDPAAVVVVPFARREVVGVRLPVLDGEHVLGEVAGHEERERERARLDLVLVEVVRELVGAGEVGVVEDAGAAEGIVERMDGGHLADADLVQVGDLERDVVGDPEVAEELHGLLAARVTELVGLGAEHDRELVLPDERANVLGRVGDAGDVAERPFRREERVVAARHQMARRQHGLPDDEPFVVRGRQRLGDGARVDHVEADEAQPALVGAADHVLLVELVALDAVLRVVAVVGVPREALDQPRDVLWQGGGDLGEVREVVTQGERGEVVERVMNGVTS